MKENKKEIRLMKKIGLSLIGVALTLITLAVFQGGWFFNAGIIVFVIGSILSIVANELVKAPSDLNQGTMKSSFAHRGIVGYALGVIITGFYITLYWFPSNLKVGISLLDNFSFALRGHKADQWFLYGSLYTLAILLMGFKAILKYRHSRYQMIRATSIMFFQLMFAYLIPSFLMMMNSPDFYFTYFWPLKYQYLFPTKIKHLLAHPGGLTVFMAYWSVILSFIGVPILTYFMGKRWYCSWVCGCGGLANTAGDSWRHLSSKKLVSWQLERWMIYSVLLIITGGTILLWVNSAYDGEVLKSYSSAFTKWYGFFIGSAFSGVIGVGFYPILGTRVWCRFGCPQAAILGIIQKFFSRFRITTNGGQCISCGTCSTYCEMGIDVKWYAQRGQNIVRASCVGCGICSTVCPRGVLNLENGSRHKRTEENEFNYCK